MNNLDQRVLSLIRNTNFNANDLYHPANNHNPRQTAVDRIAKALGANAVDCYTSVKFLAVRGLIGQAAGRWRNKQSLRQQAGTTVLRP
jgi:hypothetical protein